MTSAILGYGLGLTSGAIMELTEQNPLIPPPYPVDYLPYTTIVGQNGLGEPIEMGPPTLTWNWDKMTLAQYDWFLGICTGASVPLFVKTRIEGGVPLQFGLFRAIMWRPKSGVRPGPLRANVEIKFTQLEQIV